MRKKSGYFFSNEIAIERNPSLHYVAGGFKREQRRWSKTIVISGVFLLIFFFFILKLHAGESPKELFTVHPGLVELDTGDNELSIGFGLLEGQGDKNKYWNVFPIRLVLKSGGNRVALYLNGLSFLTRQGMSFGREQVVRGVFNGDVVNIGGNVIVEGVVAGNVWTFGSNIILKANSKVTGDAIALGGKITTGQGAIINGNKQAVPGLYIPFLGLLTSPQSAETLLFIFDLFGVLLFILILFLISYFNPQKLQSCIQIITESWQKALLYLVASLLIIPVLIALLIASLFGIFLIPVLFVLIVLLAYLGFMAVAVRVGKIFIKGEGEHGINLFLTGLVGFALLKGPALLGRLLGLLTSELFNGIGDVLKLFGSLLAIFALLIGFGSSLVNLKKD